MRPLGASLHYAAALRTISPAVACSSRAALWSSRNYATKNPFQWLGGWRSQPNSAEEEVAANSKSEADQSQLSVFESIPQIEAAGAAGSSAPKKKHTQHKYSTANFKISHRKLNLLGRQISGKPIDSAILQMQFSEKRASKRVKSMLAVAKDHAKLKGLEEKKLIIAEAWVTKGPNVHKRIDIKGRGRFGIKQHPDARMHVILKEGKTKAELMEKERARKLKRIVSAGLVREDVPLRNPGPHWAW